MTINRIRHFFLCIMAAMLTACSSDQSESVCFFIGDSIVEGWDVDARLPELNSVNLGVSGSGIAYIESKTGQIADGDAVVLTGTNDLQHLTPDSVPGYCRRYVEAVAALGSRHIYLITILPRNLTTGIRDCDNLIITVNNLIDQEISHRQLDHITRIDAYSAMVTPDCRLHSSLTADGLHLTAQGYTILTAMLRKHIRLRHPQ